MLSKQERNLYTDSFRGFILFIMILDHLPGSWQPYTYETFGFVSVAEFFIFLSAFLIGNKFLKSSFYEFNFFIFERIKKIYMHHIYAFLIALVFLSFIIFKTNIDYHAAFYSYYEEGLQVIIYGLLLLVQPDFLDILPLYIVLMAITPFYFYIAKKYGFGTLILLSVSIWILSQTGLKHLLVWEIRSNLFWIDLGFFNAFAWQMIWVLGLYFGVNGKIEFSKKPTFIIITFLFLVCMFLIKHNYISSHFLSNFWIDKENIGILRFVNLIGLLVIYDYGRYYFLKLCVYLKPFSFLGNNSLFVFSIHSVFSVIFFNVVMQLNLGDGFKLSLIVLQLLLIYCVIKIKFLIKELSKEYYIKKEILIIS